MLYREEGRNNHRFISYLGGGFGGGEGGGLGGIANSGQIHCDRKHSHFGDNKEVS